MKDFEGVIQSIDGQVWGISQDGSTICLGRDNEVREAIANPKLTSGCPSIDQIIELERELMRKDGEQNGRKPELQKPGAFRSRITRMAKRRTANTRQTPFTKRLSGNSAKR